MSNSRKTFDKLRTGYGAPALVMNSDTGHPINEID
jgi:hypothetical protein